MKNLFIFLTFLSSSLYAQEIIKIEFSDPPVNPDNGFNIMGTFSFIEDSIEDFDGRTYKVILSENVNIEDAAYTFIYFTGYKGPSRMDKKSICLLVISNYTSSQPTFILDSNYNLDLTDDTQITKNKSDNRIKLSLSNSNNPSAEYHVELLYANDFFNQLKETYGNDTTEYKKKIRRFTAAYQQKYSVFKSTRKHPPTDIEYFFNSYSQNYKRADCILQEEEIQFGLYDWNRNGLYDDIKMEGDKILIGQYNADRIEARELFSGISLTDKNQVIRIKGKNYIIKEIEPSGKYIELIATVEYDSLDVYSPVTGDGVASDKIESKRLVLGSVVPDFKFTLTNDSKTSLHKVMKQNKFTLIDVWGTWCGGCIASLPQLKELDLKYSDRLNIIKMAFGDTKEKVETYFKKNNLKWTSGFLTEEMYKAFPINAFPTFILINPKREIICWGWGSNYLTEIDEKLEL